MNIKDLLFLLSGNDSAGYIEDAAALGPCIVVDAGEMIPVPFKIGIGSSAPRKKVMRPRVHLPRGAQLLTAILPPLR